MRRALLSAVLDLEVRALHPLTLTMTMTLTLRL